MLPTLAAGGVAVASALLASLLVLPSLASTSVERAVAVCLRGLGAALSSSSSRFFGVGEGEEREEEREEREDGEGGDGSEDAAAAASASAAFADGSRSKSTDVDDNDVDKTPSLSLSSSAAALRLRSLHRLHRQETLAARPVKGADAAALPPVLLAPHLAMRREPAESPGFEAWWDRLCAPVDAVEASSSSSSSSSESGSDGEDGDFDVDGGDLRRPLQRRRRKRRKRRKQQGPDDDRPLPPPPSKELLSRGRRSRLSIGVSKSFARLAQSVGSLAGSSKRRQQQRAERDGNNEERRAAEEGEEDEEEEAAAAKANGKADGPKTTTAAAAAAAATPPLSHSHRDRPPPTLPPRPTILLFDMAQAPPPASNLRPLIAAARAALSSAAAEPPLLRAFPSFLQHRSLRDSRRPFHPAAWARLLLALDRLLTRISALEFAASNDDVFFGDGDGRDGRGESNGGGGGCASLPWKRGVVDAMRLAFAQAAAALAHLSEEAAQGDRRPAARSLVGKGSGDLEQGRRRRGEGGSGEEEGEGEEFERANSSALCRSSSVGFVRSFRRTEESLHRALLEQIELHVRTVREAAAEATAATATTAAEASAASAADDDNIDNEISEQRQQQPPSPRTLVLPSAYTARSRFFAYSLALAVVQQMTEVDAAASACFFDCGSASASPSSSSWAALPCGAWARDLLEVFFCAPLMRRTLDRARRVAIAAAERWRLRKSLFSWRKEEDTDEGDGNRSSPPPPPPPPPPPFPKLGPNGKRVLVAGLKYFLVTFLLLTAMLAAESGSTEVARLVPSACFAAGALSMSEKVEATATKVLSWVLATVVGGAAGGVLLVGGWLPARPALLGLAVSALAGLGAAATARTGRWRTTVVLGLLTTSAISLCRYDSDCRGGVTAAKAAAASSPSSPSTLSAFGHGNDSNNRWCSTAGTVELVVSRIASVAVGVLVAAAVNVFVAPWFVSDWSLSALGSALRDVSEPFIEQQYARFYAEGEAAAAATAAARAAARRGEAGAGGRAEATEEEEIEEGDPYRVVAEEVAGVVARGLERLESEKGRKKRGGGSGGGGEEKAAKEEEEEEEALGAADAPSLPVVSSSSPSSSSPHPPPPNPSVSYSFVPFLPASARPPLSLQHEAAPRLVEVQASLARDATAWSKGVLSTPPSLQSLLRSSLSLLDALASLQVAVSTCSPSSPSSSSAAAAAAASGSSSSSRPLTGAAHLCFVRPLAPATAEVFAALRAAAAAAADHLDAVSSSRSAWSGLASFFSGEMGPPRREKKEKEKKKDHEEEGEGEDDDEDDEDDDEENDGGGTSSSAHHHHRRRHHHHHHREANAATRARLRAAIEDLRARRSVAIEAQSAARRFFHVAMARHSSSSRARARARARAAAAAAASARASTAPAAPAAAPGEEKDEEEEDEEGGEDGAFVLPQDQLRHLATMSALIKAMNRFTAVLRAAAAC